MTILVSSVGDTIITVLQEKTGRQAEDDRFAENTSEGNPADGEVQPRYVSGNNRVLFDSGTQSGTGTELADLVQNQFRQDIVMLSGKLIK